MIDLNEIEILQVAVVHEERARKYYERQASRHPAEPAGDLFAFLAGEEEGHIRKLSAKFGIPRFEAGWEEKYLPYLIDLEKLAWEEGVEAAAASGVEAVRKGLLIAKKAESHAIDYYRRASLAVTDRGTKALLSELESEEKIHLAKIESYLKEL
jgi:rubrerythrin